VMFGALSPAAEFLTDDCCSFVGFETDRFDLNSVDIFSPSLELLSRVSCLGSEDSPIMIHTEIELNSGFGPC
jgi:hypothetical protein